MEYEVRQAARKVADKIKVKGLPAIFKNAVIEFAFLQGYNALKKKSSKLGEDFGQLCEAYLTADANGMINEASEILATLFKWVFYPDLMPKK